MDMELRSSMFSRWLRLHLFVWVLSSTFCWIKSHHGHATWPSDVSVTSRNTSRITPNKQWRHRSAAAAQSARNRCSRCSDCRGAIETMPGRRGTVQWFLRWAIDEFTVYNFDGRGLWTANSSSFNENMRRETIWHSIFLTFDLLTLKCLHRLLCLG